MNGILEKVTNMKYLNRYAYSYEEVVLFLKAISKVGNVFLKRNDKHLQHFCEPVDIKKLKLNNSCLIY
jgi:hypothetical protein